MDNATDYDSFVNFGKNFVIMAWDEYNAPQANWPELVLRYWRVVDDKLGGKKKKKTLSTACCANKMHASREVNADDEIIGIGNSQTIVADEQWTVMVMYVT